QKYHSQHLCKHLVQSVQPPPMHFWCQVVCHHILPLYCHPALVSNINGMEIEHVDTPTEHPDLDEGSITDGDDHVWMGNPDMLVEG
ncbi:hypothetical protein B0F90DRAFT_1649621, partial [Multifurca ochricompacta]